MTGEELLQQGLRIAIEPQPGAAVIKYQLISSPGK
jgi:hypothetical protein